MLFDDEIYFLLQAAQLGQPVTTITGVPNAHATVLQHQPTLVQTTQHVIFLTFSKKKISNFARVQLSSKRYRECTPPMWL